MMSPSVCSWYRKIKNHAEFVDIPVMHQTSPIHNPFLYLLLCDMALYNGWDRVLGFYDPFHSFSFFAFFYTTRTSQAAATCFLPAKLEISW